MMMNLKINIYIAKHYTLYIIYIIYRIKFCKVYCVGNAQTKDLRYDP